MAMHTWFECKIRYEKTMENGMQKKVTEPYLVMHSALQKQKHVLLRR